MLYPDPFSDRQIDAESPFAEAPEDFGRPADDSYWQALAEAVDAAEGTEPHTHDAGRALDDCPVCSALLAEAREADARDPRFAS